MGQASGPEPGPVLCPCQLSHTSTPGFQQDSVFLSGVIYCWVDGVGGTRWAVLGSLLGHKTRKDLLKCESIAHKLLWSIYNL